MFFHLQNFFLPTNLPEIKFADEKLKIGKNLNSSLLTSALSFVEVWMQFHQVYRLQRYKSLSRESFQIYMYSSLLLSTKLRIQHGFQRLLYY